MSVPTEVQTLAVSLIEAANASAVKIKAATDDKGKAVEDLIESSDDEAVAKFRAWRDDIDAKREAAYTKVREDVKARLVPSGENVDVEAEKNTYKDAAAKAKEARKFFVMMGGKEADLPAIVGLRGSSSTGAQSGIKRPRLSSVTCDGKTVQGEIKQGDGTIKITHTFTDLAKFLKSESGEKVSGSDLQALAFEAAGTEDLSSKAGQEVSFTTTLKDHTYTVVVTPADPEAAPAK